MIWYEVKTWTPYAPGSYENGGTPSIDTMHCPFCGPGPVQFTYRDGRCQRCKKILLTQL